MPDLPQQALDAFGSIPCTIAGATFISERWLVNEELLRDVATGSSDPTNALNRDFGEYLDHVLDAIQRLREIEATPSVEG